MDKLRSYSNSLSAADRGRFLSFVGVAEGYLRKAMSIGKVGPVVAARIEAATNGRITRENLRPDIFGPLPKTMAEPHRESA